MASVSETGWPYVQHRGGPPGFVRVLDEQHDRLRRFPRQPPVHQRRQRLTGRPGLAVLHGLSEPDAAEDPRPRARWSTPPRPRRSRRLELPGYRARVERGFLISIEAFDWNCPQHITPRFTLAEIEGAIPALQRRIAELEARLKACQSAENRP